MILTLIVISSPAPSCGLTSLLTTMPYFYFYPCATPTGTFWISLYIGPIRGYFFSGYSFGSRFWIDTGAGRESVLFDLTLG